MVPEDKLRELLLVLAAAKLSKREWYILAIILAGGGALRKRDFAEITGLDAGDVGKTLSRMIRDHMLAEVDGSLIMTGIETWSNERKRRLVKHQFTQVNGRLVKHQVSPIKDDLIDQDQQINIVERKDDRIDGVGKTPRRPAKTAKIRKKDDDGEVGKMPRRPAKTEEEKTEVGKTPRRKLPERGLAFTMRVKRDLQARGAILKPDFHLKGAGEVEALFRQGATEDEMWQCYQDLVNDGVTVIDSMSTICRLFGPWRMCVKSGRRWIRGRGQSTAYGPTYEAGRNPTIEPVRSRPKRTSASADNVPGGETSA